jgi:hypothetical protein
MAGSADYTANELIKMRLKKHMLIGFDLVTKVLTKKKFL